jgi:hypothetical protein
VLASAEQVNARRHPSAVGDGIGTHWAQVNWFALGRVHQREVREQLLQIRFRPKK